jgi:hypothetical protein
MKTTQNRTGWRTLFARHISPSSGPVEIAPAADETRMTVTPEQRRSRINSLREIIKNLSDLNATTEAGFITVGSNLQSIFLRTKEVSKNLSIVVEGFSEQGASSMVEGLKEITDTSMRYLKSFDETSKAVVERLSLISSLMKEMPDIVQTFDRLVSRLRIMGIATRIETARLGLFNMGFEHLADEVTSLGEKISGQAKDVKANIRTIIEIVSNNETKLRTLRAGHTAVYQTVSVNMNSDLQLLNEKHEALAGVIGDITNQSNDAIHMLHAIVSSVQFHDITRQEIEHVVEALRNLEQQLQDGEEDVIPDTIITCELQPLHLQRVREQFDNAILSIVSSFGHLASTVNMIEAESKEVVGFAGDSGTTLFDSIEESLLAVNVALVEGERLIREFLNAIDEINGVVERVKACMEAMSEAGIEIELLSFNSRIRGAKVNEAGAALGVIAESIQHLSVEARAQIEIVIQHIIRLIRETEGMRSLTEGCDICNATEHTIETMNEKLHAMIGVFHTSNVAGVNVLRQTETVCTGLSNELASLANTIRKHRTMIDVIQRSEAALVEIAKDARDRIPDIILSELEHRLDEMKTRYTMSAEREAHAAYFGKQEEGVPASGPGNQPAEGSVELF